MAGKYKVFHIVKPKQGDLIGIAPGKVTVEIIIPSNFTLSIDVGSRVEAGETSLAELNC